MAVENTTEYPQLRKGDRVYFANEKRPYTVKAVGGQFAICTKPFNVQRTCLYTIIDFKEKVRGPNNLVFNMYDYTVEEEIEQSLNDLLSGEIEISRRRGIFLDLIKVIHCGK